MLVTYDFYEAKRLDQNLKGVRGKFILMELLRHETFVEVGALSDDALVWIKNEFVFSNGFQRKFWLFNWLLSCCDGYLNFEKKLNIHLRC